MKIRKNRNILWFGNDKMSIASQENQDYNKKSCIIFDN